MECLVDRTKLRSRANHQYLTQSMFYEYRGKHPEVEATFTLKEDDWKGYLSAYKIYMSCDTEYEAAIKMLGSWKHWQILSKSPFFRKELEAWRLEMKLREEAIAKKTISKLAREGNLTAAKYLMDYDSRKPGRPTKLEIEAEKQKAVKSESKIASIVQRMNDIK